MSTLLYRSHSYDQRIQPGKPSVQLKYRRSIDLTRQETGKSASLVLRYRGVSYTR